MVLLVIPISAQMKPIQPWPKHQVTWMRKLLVLLRGDAPNFAAFSLATLEHFITAPVPNFGSKRDPFISVLAEHMSWPSFTYRHWRIVMQ
jgi:hypothetical protein